MSYEQAGPGACRREVDLLMNQFPCSGEADAPGRDVVLFRLKERFLAANRRCEEEPGSLFSLVPVGEPFSRA